LKDLGAESLTAVQISPEQLAGLIALTERGVISSSAAKTVFEAMWGTGRTAQAIVDADGLAQSSDESEIARLVADVIAAHPDSVTQIRGGRNNVLGFLVGLVMKASGGKANPKMVTALLNRAINGE
jgi:aspartyl-tRNA(Asn)/glutamyl-tRNA(Gln) amidotransferase subunit B